jgi:outer membrane receptor protein involved in Fe transport
MQATAFFNLRRTLALLAAASLLWGAIPVEAQPETGFEKTFGDIETVSIATGRSQSIQTAPAVASVITAEQIRDTGARDLIDILRLVPGFYLGRTANLFDPVLGVRRFSSSFNQTVLFMLDGVPQTELVFGNRRTTLGKIPLDLIERVEIIRGPGSALYGADAYSAVVNVITRREVPEQAQAVLSGGSHDTRNFRALAGRRFGEMKVVGALEYSETDGYAPFVEADQQTRLDALFGTQTSLAPGTANTGRQEFGAQVNLTGPKTSLGLRVSDERGLGLGTGVTGVLDPFGSVDSTVWEGTFKYRDQAGDWAVNGFLDGVLQHYRMDNWHFFAPGAFGGFPDGVIYNNAFEQRYLRLQNVLGYTRFRPHDLTLGLGAELGRIELQSESRNYRLSDGSILPIGSVQDTTGDSALGDTTFSRDLFYAYVQDEWTFHPDWTLTWGARYDHYSDVGATVNPRAALVWNARHDLTAKLLYGSGFRSPSLLETQARQIPALWGNSDLQPEYVDAIELALDYRPRLDLRTRVNLFYHETDDQIRLQNTGGAEFRPENVGQQKGRGLEVELWWDLTRATQFYGYYAYQDNTDETTGADAGYTPHHQALAMLQTRQRPWLFTVQARYVGERDRVAEDQRSPPDTYALLDVFARYTFSKHLEASLDIRNLFDADVRDAGFGTAFPGDIPLPGRTFYFSLISRF